MRADIKAFAKAVALAKDIYFRFAKVHKHSIFVISFSVDTVSNPHFF
jgi:hypothetical protein